MARTYQDRSTSTFHDYLEDPYLLDIRSGRTIRILDLHPLSATEDGRQLQGTFRAHTLSLDHSEEQFEALSYVWGTQEHADKGPFIRCNGIDIPITNNCRDALSRFSHTDGHRSLWVDSICINQNNMEERNHQISLMLAIYSKAKTVLIWLPNEGSTDVETHAAIRCIREVKTRHVDEDFKRTQDALALLLSNSWFSRGWTFQELVLGQNPVFFTNQDSLPWHDVSRLVLRYASNMHAQPSLERFLSLITLWSTVNTRNRFGIITVRGTMTLCCTLVLLLTSPQYFCQKARFPSPQDGRPKFFNVLRDIVFFLANLYEGGMGVRLEEAPTWLTSGYLRMLYPFGSWLRNIIVLGIFSSLRLGPGLQFPFAWPGGCPRRLIFVFLALWTCKRLGKGYFIQQCRALIDAAYLALVLPRIVYAHYHWRDIPGLSHLYRRNRQLECAGLMEALWTRRVSDVKDKAYAMHGILDKIGVSTKPADYSIPCQEIFSDLFLSLINWRATMLALLVHAGKVSSEVHDMPSWVPDWRTDTDSVWLPEDVLRRCTYNSVYTGVRAYGMPFYSINGDELTVLGRQLDTVALVVHVPHKTLSQPDSAVLDAISKWLLLVRGPSDLKRGSTWDAEALDLLYLAKQDARNDESSLSQRARLQPWYRDLVVDGLRVGAKPNDHDDRNDLESEDDIDSIQVDLQHRICGKRLLFVTQNGRYGTGSLNIQEGDTVHAVSGVPMPLCLRRQANSDVYEIAGPAIMNNDSSDDIWQGRLNRIVLV
jgi:hypothetical protein